MRIMAVKDHGDYMTVHGGYIGHGQVQETLVCLKTGKVQKMRNLGNCRYTYLFVIMVDHHTRKEFAFAQSPCQNPKVTDQK